MPIRGKTILINHPIKFFYTKHYKAFWYVHNAGIFVYYAQRDGKIELTNQLLWHFEHHFNLMTGKEKISATFACRKNRQTN